MPCARGVDQFLLQTLAGGANLGKTGPDDDAERDAAPAALDDRLNRAVRAKQYQREIGNLGQ